MAKYAIVQRESAAPITTGFPRPRRYPRVLHRIQRNSEAPTFPSFPKQQDKRAPDRGTTSSRPLDFLANHARALRDAPVHVQ
jgi:hypothetical protein